MANLKTESPLATLAKFPPPPDLANVPLPDDRTIAAIAREVAFIVPKDIRAKVAALQSAFEMAQQSQIEHTGDFARKAFWSQQSRMETDAAESRDIAKRDAWSEEDWREDYQLKCAAFRTETFRISVEAHKLSLPLIEGFATKATALADALEAQEIAVADRFCTRHVPSDSVLAVKKLAAHILQSVTQFYPKSGASPKSLFSHLPVTFEASEK